MASLVTATVRNSALRLVLSNGKKRNPLSGAAINELEQALKGLSADNKECRAVVITAEGPVFSAGHDLRELRSLSKADQYALFERCGRLMNSLRKLEVPVIAAVEGLAAAAGCQLVAACDIAMAGPEAKFSLPGAGVGLFCSAPSVPVVRCANAKGSAYMLYTGRPIDAQQALTYGLISHCAKSNDELHKLVEETVQDIAGKPCDVIALGKRFLNRDMVAPEAKDYGAAAQVMTDNLQLDNAKEGLEAFVSKRHPLWK